MRRIAVVVAVAGVGLAACTTLSPEGTGGGGRPKPLANCDGSGACKVDVAVTNCVITPNPDPLTVTAKNVNIFWELDAASRFFYRFPDDGVKLKEPSPEFDAPEAQANRKKFKLHDKNSKTGQTISYSYMIKVQRLVPFQWVDCPPLDPIIVNQG